MSGMMRRTYSRPSLWNVWKKCVLTCAALAVLTSGCATTAAPPAGEVKQHRLTRAEQPERTSAASKSTGPLPATADGPPPVVYDIGENCLRYRYSEQSHCPSDVQEADCKEAVSDGDCGVNQPLTLTNWWCQEVESDDSRELQKWHVFCQGYVPTTVTYDIGEHCIKYRYSEQSHCEGEVPMNDCLAAQTSGDCGIKLPFILSNARCQQVDTHQVQKWHVFCDGTVPSGPLPQPQCPSNHVLGDPGQDCVGSCTKHCDRACIGGYCTDGNYSTCYSQYQEQCDCGVPHCPCTGPNCNAGEQ